MSEKRKPNTESEGAVITWYDIGYEDGKEERWNPPTGVPGTKDYDRYKKGFADGEKEGNDPSN